MGPHRKEKKNSTVRAGVNGRKNRASGWCISLESHIETKLGVMLLKEIYPRWHTTCFQHKCFACCTGRLRLKTPPFHSFFFSGANSTFIEYIIHTKKGSHAVHVFRCVF